MNAALEVLRRLGMAEGEDALEFIASRELSKKKIYMEESDEVAAHLYPLADALDNYELSAARKATLSDQSDAVKINDAKAFEIYHAFEQMGFEQFGDEPFLLGNLLSAGRIASTANKEQRAGYIASRAERNLAAEAPTPTPATPAPTAPAPAQKSGFFSGFNIGAGRTGAQVAQQTDEYTNRVLKGIGLGGEDAEEATVAEAKAYMGSADAKFADGSALNDQQKAVLSQTRDSFYKSGTMYSDDAIGAMGSNFASTGNVFGGLSAATETTSGNALLRSVQEGGVMGVALMGGALGAAGGMLTGGDASEGAMIGAALGAGVGGVSRAITKSAPEIEAAMMRRLLGDDYDKLGQKTVTTPGKVTPEMRLQEAKEFANMDDLELVGYRFPEGEINKVTNLPDGADTFDHTLNDVAGTGMRFNDSVSDSYIPETVGNFQSVFSSKSNQNNNTFFIDESQLRQAATTTTSIEDLGVNEARQARLQTIRSMTDDQLDKVSGGRAMQKRLTSNKEDSLLTQTRTLTMAGAFLGGVAFTSKKNDHRRGFNKNRGNRI